MLGAIVFFALLILLIYVWRTPLLRILKMIHSRLQYLTPWLLLVTMSICITILCNVQPKEKLVSIPFDDSNGAVFNSWDYRPEESRYIEAYGEVPGSLGLVIDKFGAASFCYRTNAGLVPDNPDASSGCCVMFYDTPCDLLSLREIRFACKATDTEGLPDVGIRLAVDIPNLSVPPPQRELVTYEIPSLVSYFAHKRSIENTWRSFTIDVNDFELKRIVPPLPPGMTENTINKVVFFVNLDIVRSCSRGKLWFKDILFLTGQQHK